MPPSPANKSLHRSLAGSWQLALDHTDLGLADHWFARPLVASTPIELPGSLAVQKIGADVTPATPWTGTIFDRAYYESPDYAHYREPGQIKIPFFLQPEKVFVGAAWYQRDIEIPPAWQGRRIILTCERPHWKTTVWLDDIELGSRDSLSVPHEYSLPQSITPGQHRLTLRIDNRLLIAVGENAHSVSDHTQGNWNGCIGRLELNATALIWIDDVQVTPHIATRSITVHGTLGGNLEAQAVTLAVKISTRISGASDQTQVDSVATIESTVDGRFDAELNLGSDASLWDEFNPALHTLTVSLANGEQRCVRFGLREISTRGTQFLVNDRPAFFRGTLDCCVFPLTGHPPTDVASWRRILGAVQAHGLNHVRFHSWCPPEAAFIAGDELGVYFQVEAATWPNAVAVLAFNSPAGIGDGASVDPWTLREAERIVRAYGNHPCFVLMAAGNEPGGPHHRAYLAHWLTHLRALDPRRLYTGAAGWPELPENDFHVIPEPRCHQWGDGLASRLNALPPATTADYRESVTRRDRPVIAHEIGQWCAYPSLADEPKYTGHLSPKNYEIFADSLAAHHLTDRQRDFVHASGKLQALCYKEEIESALRTPGLGGFQLLGLHDFPGQGTAPVGVLNALGESKGYISAQDYRRFCNAGVPLVRLEKRIFTTEETLRASVEFAWFGPATLDLAIASWQLVNDVGHVLLTGQCPSQPAAVGKITVLGQLEIPLRHLPAPCRYKLSVELLGTPFTNDWEVWVYPTAIANETIDDVVLASSLAEAAPALAAGKKVLLFLHPAGAKSTEELQQPNPPLVSLGSEEHPNCRSLLASDQREERQRLAPIACKQAPTFDHRPASDHPEPIVETSRPLKIEHEIALGFTPIFWNTSCTQRQAPHTLGILCDPVHPAFADFPTDAHTNWQWWHLINRAVAMRIDALPPTLQPIVTVIDDWFTNRRLALVFEARVGPGRLLVCSIDLTGDLTAQPVARQLHASLLRYLHSEKFQPSEMVSLENLQTILPR